MSLNKQTKITSIEVAGDHKHINLEQKITIKENGVLISETNHRVCYSPDTDIATLDSEVAAIANTVWTQAVKDAYAAAVALV